MLVMLATFPTRGEAEIIHSILESEGIHCVLSADDAGGQYGGMTLSSGVGIQVNEADLERAQEILEAKPERDAS